uniref:G-protein coupled receptors family 1 profile domain-containing protein n=1 Tax=Glossina palpalis gambiensis TaxID=67801 RepID=A0A1B0BUC5_9MUSC
MNNDAGNPMAAISSNSTITTTVANKLYSIRKITTNSSAAKEDYIFNLPNVWEGFSNVAVSRDVYEMLFNNTPANNNTQNSSLLDTSIINATEIPYVPYGLRPETYIVPILFALIFIVGVLGNGTLIVVFLTVRQMRNVPNTYIFSLALADLLVIVTTVPLTSTVYTVESWPWGSFLCTLSEFFKDVSIGVSVFTLTALSGDRYFAIVDPFRKFHAHGCSKGATRITIAIAISIWILAIICGLPALITTHIKSFYINSNKSFSTCYPFPEEWGQDYAKTMILLRFLVYYAVPLIIISVFYILIARHLMFTAHVPGEMQGAVRQIRARRKVALTVLAFVVIFGVCFLPIHVSMLWFYYWPTAQRDYNTFWHVLRIMGFCLSFANSCANPVALYLVSGAFRKHFNRYLCCQDNCSRNIVHKDNTMCMHRNTTLTSTTSKRYYHSSLSRLSRSTIRSRLQETAITTVPNGNHNHSGGNGVINAKNVQGDMIDVALTSARCQQHQHQHEFM